MPDHTVEIAQLKAKLAAGAKRVRTDGVEVEYDLDMIRQRLSELERANDSTRLARPPWARVDLSNQ